MAYNRTNLLLRVIDVQRIYKQHSKNFDGGCTDKYIYDTYIKPLYRISKVTFYTYLGINATKELKDMAEK